MHPFSLHTLLLPGSIIFLLTLIVAVGITKNIALSIVAAFLKTGIFVLYFGYFFDGTWTFQDDWTYLEGGQQLLENDVAVSNLSDNWEFALMVGRGDHFIYYLVNTYAFRFFGEGYYAPVALNILFTILIAAIGTYLARKEFGWKDKLKNIFFVFLLFNPDILAWSNVMNGKDILVLLLHIILLLAISFYYQRRFLIALLLVVPCFTTLFFLRFYAPFLFSVAFILTPIFVGKKGKLSTKIITLSLAICVLSAVVYTIGIETLTYGLDNLREKSLNPVFGFVRFILTPIPFNTEVAYSFLNIPAFIHWLLLPYAFLGFLQIRKIESPFSRYLILYFLVFLVLYSVSAELQGPRARVQLDFAIALFQFIGIKEFIRRYIFVSKGNFVKTIA